MFRDSSRSLPPSGRTPGSGRPAERRATGGVRYGVWGYARTLGEAAGGSLTATIVD
jgi:hypothetical protein